MPLKSLVLSLKIQHILHFSPSLGHCASKTCFKRLTLDSPSVTWIPQNKPKSAGGAGASVNHRLVGTIPGSVKGRNGGPGRGEAGQGPGGCSGPIGAVTGRWGPGSVLRWLPPPRGGPEGCRLDGAVASRSPSCRHCPLTFSPTSCPLSASATAASSLCPRPTKLTAASGALRRLPPARVCPSAQQVATPSRPARAHPSPLGHALLFILFTISLVPIVILSSFIPILLFLDPC